jgi:S1-C subfamily serine protease
MNDASQVVCALGRQEAGGLTLLGTAFAVGPRKVATAYHVTGASDEGLAIVVPRFPSMLAYQDTADTSVTSMSVRIVAADPLKDLCVLEFVRPDAQFTFAYGLSGTDSVPPGAPVVTLGFPHANFGRMVLTQQVAHVGARILIENTGQKSKHIVLNTQARDGQSGGPVFDASLNSVVAVLLGSYAPGGGGGISLGGVDPATLHQTTHAISAEYLGAML